MRITSVHSATLGKGKSDDTLIKVRNGDLRGKGEVAMVFGKQVGGVSIRTLALLVLIAVAPCTATTRVHEWPFQGSELFPPYVL
jgi:hypothetical protein